MEVNAPLPFYLRAAFSDVGDLSPSLCLKCGAVASTCVETSNELYKDGECYELSCGVSHCKSPLWAFCKLCNKRFTKRNLSGHVASREHRKNSFVPNFPDPGVDSELLFDEFPAIHEVPRNVQESPSLGSMCSTDEDLNLCFDKVTASADGSVLNGSSLSAIDADVFLPTMYDDDVPNNETQTGDPITHPKLCMGGNEKLNEFFQSIPEASVSEVVDAFSDLGPMRDFWSAEHASPKGHCGGGLQYTVGRAFSRAALGIINQVPSIDESLWHLECFSQYLSMNETQRKRQTRIMNAFQGGSMFQATRVPTINEAAKVYGRQGQHSMWNTLPIPPVESIDGIGYVSPIHILKFLFSCGAPVDDIFVTIGCKETNKDGSTVNHVSESLRASEFIADILRAHEEAVRFGQRFCLATWLADWRDGFGPNRTKGNRNSVVAWTITISPPKDQVNATSNTFLVALGSKKNSAWPKVEHRFRTDMETLQDVSKPLMVYHGTLRKIIPVCSRRLASLEDKVERPDVTATIACTSDFHRCFGTALKITTPTIDIPKLNRSFLNDEKVGLKQPFPGWSDPYVSQDTNGAKFPACRDCRTRGWNRLLGEAQIVSVPPVCAKCTNWGFEDPSGATLLHHPPPDNYPSKKPFEECTLPVPEGRSFPADSLPPVRLSFDFMKTATRYAFYHASAAGRNSWNKGECRAYLRSCGIGSMHQEEILAAALLAKESGVCVDYDDSEGVGDFRFPASWIGDLTLHQYIELAMHQLFLGIAKSNFELINKWVLTVGFGSDNVKKKLQPLLKEIKKLQLSFCLTHEFSGNEGTGAWISENWLAFTRFSKILYGNIRSFEKSDGTGIEDVERMVASYNALVARLLTHSGINPTNICEIHLYMKEFLSTVRELDIRVRHKVLAKHSAKKQPAKKSPARKQPAKKKSTRKANESNNKESQQSNTKANGSHEKSRKRKRNNAMESLSPPEKPTEPKDNNTGKKLEAWWLKSNYMSLLNLIQILAELGPLVLWWDGGGKGERFIQDIKPHIPRGVRNDQPNYYVKLTERVYKMRCLYYLEKRYDGTITIDPTIDMEAEAAEAYFEENEFDDDTSYASEICESSSSSSSSGGSSTGVIDSESEDDNQTNFVSQVEDLAMHKARTIYVYRNEATLNRAVVGIKPLSGIAVHENSEGYDMYCIYRMAGRKFGLRRVAFNDSIGSSHNGLWYAPLAVQETTKAPLDDFTSVQKMAKMSVVAVPFKYSCEPAHEHSAHYCAVTNWWKERNSDGQYNFPDLDPDMYSGMNPGMDNNGNQEQDAIDTPDGKLYAVI